MKSRTVLSILLFFASITLLLYLLNRQMETGANQQQGEQSEIEMHFRRMNDELNKTLKNTVIQNCSVEDTLSKEYFLSDLVSQRPVLFFRYSEINCSPCFLTALLSLHTVFADESRQIAILSSYRDRRQFISFQKANQIELPFYRIPQDAFNWVIEDHMAPYYFVLHPDLTVSHIYIPDRGFPELNKQYLEEVKKYLSSK